MMFKRKKKLNNKGFTLMELMVALAVSATVMTIIGSFVTQGSKFYSKTGNSVNLQNELQEVSNVVCDTLQEATYLEIQSDTNAVTIFTGSYSKANGIDIFDSGKGTARRINWDGSSIFVFDKASMDQVTDIDKKGYCYSKVVDNINVKVSNKCKDGDKYNQPLMLDISIRVSKNGTDRSETKTITLRNVIKELRVGGDTYTIIGGNQLMKVEDEIIEPDDDTEVTN